MYCKLPVGVSVKLSEVRWVEIYSYVVARCLFGVGMLELFGMVGVLVQYRATGSELMGGNLFICGSGVSFWDGCMYWVWQYRGRHRRPTVESVCSSVAM